MARTKIEVGEYGIPISEVIKVKERDHTGTIRYIITQHQFLSEFYLYQITDNKSKKIDTQDTPSFKKLEKEREKWIAELEKENNSEN